jgi:hypothetical protein
MFENFDFGSLQLIEVPITGPDRKKYMLREASGDAVAKFNNARARCVRFQNGGMSAVDGQGDLEPLLVSYCLFEVYDTGEVATKSVPVAMVRNWPERVIRRIYDKAREISEIDQDGSLEDLKKQRDKLNEQIAKMEEDASKNEQEPSATGSE